jgi:Polyketide cyclase / dehydrase and lipid transport
MLKITVSAPTSASPERVLALAGTDFSAHRAKVWPNVTTRKLDVHERGDTWIEVTEGATGIARFAWERTRYDWSDPGTVKQTVLDSNVVEPGSTWELRVTASEGGGSTVEMTVERRFRRSLTGHYGHMLNRAAGKRGWSWFLRQALKAVERASPRESDAAPPQEAFSSR